MNKILATAGLVFLGTVVLSFPAAATGSHHPKPSKTPCPTPTVTQTVSVPGPTSTVTETATVTATATATVTETATATATETAPGIPGPVSTVNATVTSVATQTVTPDGEPVNRVGTTNETPSELAHTGSNLGKFLALGLVLLVIGGVVLFLTRKNSLDSDG